ncbi:MAG: reactive intermediate/imine deaminase [Deltaproteobacteria bacterium HGW-Deltaproteobacteria-2]|jgi:2-iminobutanoate/2-iminopropanoate deaminase|nr:MAG: reactive intermediate/imine deaminase [Deltaproteobacteria bacterium HGW-Deltaproteobacteria-2]
MKKNIIASSKFPVAGPYSAAVEVNDIIFISGQLPIDPSTGEIIKDIKTAARQVLINIQTILEQAGLDMSNVVKTTIFLKNIADFPTVNEIYATFFPEEPPARSTVEVSALPKGAPLEIEAIAIRK